MVAIIALAVVATFFSNTLEEKTHALSSHLSTYKSLVVNRDSALNNLLEDLHASKITTAQYYQDYKKVILNYKTSHKEYLSIKKQLKKEQSVLGYTSKKNFYLSFGIRFFALVVCVLYFYKIVRTVYSSLNKKYFNLITGSVILITGVYWFSWSLVFKVNSIGDFDFEQWHQNILQYVLPFVVLIAVFLLANYYNIKDAKYSFTIKNLFRYVYDSQNDIIQEKRADHAVKRGRLVKETLDNVG